ncbi:MAG: bifunctional folylpolyglutamate synthase/dihydrofolate synthase, partial [Peribacillus sp.]
MVTDMNEINRFFEERQVQLGMNFGLSRMETLLAKLGNPHVGLKYIHIAGSNGKGSTLQFIKEILLAEGLRVASFTSPYLIRLNEQVKINREEISNEDFVSGFQELWPIVQEMDGEGNGPTQFEILTAMAFSYFSKKGTDLVLLETGLGGRLDTTNVVQPLLSIITSISLEHTNILGNTLGEIAFEKAGIIKKGAPIISGVTT